MIERSSIPTRGGADIGSPRVFWGSTAPRDEVWKSVDSLLPVRETIGGIRNMCRRVITELDLSGHVLTARNFYRYGFELNCFAVSARPPGMIRG